MLIAALAAALASPPPAGPVAARVEARASVRIVRGTAIRFEVSSGREQPPAVERPLKLDDGRTSVVRLVEFQ